MEPPAYPEGIQFDNETCSQENRTICYTIRYATDSTSVQTVYLVAVAEGGSTRVSEGITVDIQEPADVSTFGGGRSEAPYLAQALEPSYVLSVLKDSDDRVIGDETTKITLPPILDPEGDAITMKYSGLEALKGAKLSLRGADNKLKLEINKNFVEKN